MPSISHLLETALYCDDLARTATFYGRLLDREPMLAGERLVSFHAGQSTVLLLFQRGRTVTPLETPTGRVPAHDGSGPVHLAFAIDAAEVEAWRERLTALGIEIESRVRWTLGGESLYFRDPDGRSVELATRGTWPEY